MSEPLIKLIWVITLTFLLGYYQRNQKNQLNQRSRQMR